MLCKRMALALLLPLSLTALIGVGCGGSNDPVVAPPAPQPSSDAGVDGFAISGVVGELSAPFNPSLTRYSTTVGLLGEDSIGVTVTLRDAKATLRVNGQQVESGMRTNVPLLQAVNTINAVVTAEDGITSNTVTLTVNRTPTNTTVYVLNGMGGVPVRDAVLTIRDSENKLLADKVSLPANRMGEPFLGLEPGRKYNIYATGTASAVACHANFDPAKESTVALYCANTSTAYYALEAPVIEKIEFGTANTDAGGTGGWKEMPNSAYYVGTPTDITAVKVTYFTRNLNARSLVPDTYDEWDSNTRAAYPFHVNLDQIASSNAGGATGATGTVVGTRNTPVTEGGKVIGYRNAYRAAVPLLQANIFNKEHFLSITVADCIGNRTEQRVYLTITNSTTNQAADPDLTGVVPELDLAQAQTFVGSGNMQSKPGEEKSEAVGELENYNGFAQVITQFYARSSSTTALAIRGYEVWRSIGDESNFVKIATVNYAATSSQTTVYQFLDRTPSIALGNMYYKFRFFNGNPANHGFSQFSKTLPVKVLPPFYIKNASDTVSTTLWPKFKVQMSDANLLKKETFGQMTLCLTVKYADNPYMFLMVPMLITGAKITGDPYDWPGLAAYARTGFTYTQSGSGNSTTWTIPAYGASGGGSWTSCYDVKEVDDVDGEGQPIKKTVYTPFVTVENNNTIVIDTGSKAFQTIMENAVRAAQQTDGDTLQPGTVYYWNVMGSQAGMAWNSPSYPGRWATNTNTQATWYGCNEYNTHLSPTNGTFRGCSYGSGQIYGFGSPEGWFPLIIAADAE